jgi:hypothetical protein
MPILNGGAEDVVFSVFWKTMIGEGWGVIPMTVGWATGKKVNKLSLHFLGQLFLGQNLHQMEKLVPQRDIGKHQVLSICCKKTKRE